MPKGPKGEKRPAPLRRGFVVPANGLRGSGGDGLCLRRCPAGETV